jgi:hypothetical protein
LAGTGVRERIAHEVNAATLPSSVDNLADRHLEVKVRIGNDERKSVGNKYLLESFRCCGSWVSNNPVLCSAQMFICPNATRAAARKTALPPHSAQPAQDRARNVSVMAIHQSDQCTKCYTYICQCARAAEAQSHTYTSIDDLNAQLCKSLSKSGFTDLTVIVDALRKMEELGVRFVFPEAFIRVSSASYPSSGDERHNQGSVDPHALNPGEASGAGTSMFRVPQAPATRRTGR